MDGVTVIAILRKRAIDMKAVKTKRLSLSVLSDSKHFKRAKTKILRRLRSQILS